MTVPIAIAPTISRSGQALGCESNRYCERHAAGAEEVSVARGLRSRKAAQRRTKQIAAIRSARRMPVPRLTSGPFRARHNALTCSAETLGGLRTLNFEASDRSRRTADDVQGGQDHGDEAEHHLARAARRAEDEHRADEHDAVIALCPTSTRMQRAWYLANTSEAPTRKQKHGYRGCPAVHCVPPSSRCGWGMADLAPWVTQVRDNLVVESGNLPPHDECQDSQLRE